MSDKNPEEVVSSGIVGGLGFGCTLVIVISWHAHQSILWAIFHGLFGSLYVIYWGLSQ